MQLVVIFSNVRDLKVRYGYFVKCYTYFDNLVICFVCEKFVCSHDRDKSLIFAVLTH